MSESKIGLYYPNGQMLTIDQIRRKNAPPVEVSPIPIPTQRSLDQWTQHLSEMQRMRDEVLPLPSSIDIKHAAHEPVFYALFGDIHAGGDKVDYVRVKDEVQAVKETDGAFAFMLGDVMDNFFFNPAQHEDIININEQALYSRKVLDELKGKLMAGWAGNHELWSSRDGLTMYHDFVERYGAHYLEGLVHVGLTVGDSLFHVFGAHQFGGHSIYNAAHPEHRMQREEGDGGDIFIGAHTHHKAVNRQTVKGVGGGREVLYISLGAYKSSDSFARKLGHSPLTPSEMGGVGLIFYPDDKRVDAHWDIQEGIKAFKKL